MSGKIATVMEEADSLNDARLQMSKDHGNYLVIRKPGTCARLTRVIGPNSRQQVWAILRLLGVLGGRKVGNRLIDQHFKRIASAWPTALRSKSRYGR